MSCSGRPGLPGRRPYLPYPCLPLDTRSPFLQRKVSGQKRAAETHSGWAADTCEARHLRANRGRPGLRRAHPLGAGCFAAAGTSVPASYRRARRLLISMAPAPPPPPAAAAVAAVAAAVAAAATGGRDTKSSGLHRHVRRAANCIVGGEGSKGGGEGEEGKAEKEVDPRKEGAIDGELGEWGRGETASKTEREGTRMDCYPGVG